MAANSSLPAIPLSSSPTPSIPFVSTHWMSKHDPRYLFLNKIHARNNARPEFYEKEFMVMVLEIRKIIYP